MLHSVYRKFKFGWVALSSIICKYIHKLLNGKQCVYMYIVHASFKIGKYSFYVSFSISTYNISVNMSIYIYVCVATHFLFDSTLFFWLVRNIVLKLPSNNTEKKFEMDYCYALLIFDFCEFNSPFNFNTFAPCSHFPI